MAANSAAVRFFQSQGLDRIVLPRFLSPADMGEITAAAPEMEYEAMVIDDGCPLVDGYCRSIHGCGYLPRDDGVQARQVIATWDVSGSAHHLCQDLGRPAAGSPPCAACAQPLPWPEQGPGLPVSIYHQHALLGLFPCEACAGETAACAGVTQLIKRGGRTLYREHNLIWWATDNPPPSWADRLVLW